MATLRAVLVGVDEYERSDIPPLHGCVNDVALVRTILKECLGVPNEDIRVVVNQRATKDSILHRLQRMLRASEPGDVAFFYFSGHGSQIRDRDGDELTDALDEVICPYDMDWDRRTYILDDDLLEIFDAAGPDVLLEAFFDCCFWGSGQQERGSDPAPQSLRGDVRYLPPPFDIAARVDGELDRVDIHRLTQADAFPPSSVIWAASREGQSSAEDYFDGRVNGVFTYWGFSFIAGNIERVEQGAYSRGELLADVRAYVGSLGYGQMPVLDAPFDLQDGPPLLPAPDAGPYPSSWSIPGAAR